MKAAIDARVVNLTFAGNVSGTRSYLNMTVLRIGFLLALLLFFSGCSWLGGSAYRSSKVKPGLFTFEQFEVDLADQILGEEKGVPRLGREIVEEYVRSHADQAKSPLRFRFYHSCLAFQFPATAPTEPDITIAEGTGSSLLWTGGDVPHIVPDNETRSTPDAEISMHSTMGGASWPSAEYHCLLLVSCDSASPSDSLLMVGNVAVRMAYRDGKWSVLKPQIAAFRGFE